MFVKLKVNIDMKLDLDFPFVFTAPCQRDQLMRPTEALHKFSHLEWETF